MDFTTRLSDQLRSLPDDRLAALFERRDEVLPGSPVLDLDDLTGRLQHPYSVAAVLPRLVLPFRQVLEAARAVGRSGTVVAVAALPAGEGTIHRDGVDGIQPVRAV